MTIKPKFSYYFLTIMALAMLFIAGISDLQSPAKAQSDSPQSILDQYLKEADKEAGDVDSGLALFSNKHGQEWSCSSCHGLPPTQIGKHVVTGKSIAPMAPAFNPERFSDAEKSEKWFRRNCNDVLGRECTASEKSDVIAYLLSLK